MAESHPPAGAVESNPHAVEVESAHLRMLSALDRLNAETDGSPSSSSRPALDLGGGSLPATDGRACEEEEDNNNNNNNKNNNPEQEQILSDILYDDIANHNHQHEPPETSEPPPPPPQQQQQQHPRQQRYDKHNYRDRERRQRERSRSPMQRRSFPPPPNARPIVQNRPYVPKAQREQLELEQEQQQEQQYTHNSNTQSYSRQHHHPRRDHHHHHQQHHHHHHQPQRYHYREREEYVLVPRREYVARQSRVLAPAPARADDDYYYEPQPLHQHSPPKRGAPPAVAAAPRPTVRDYEEPPPIRRRFETYHEREQYPPTRGAHPPHEYHSAPPAPRAAEYRPSVFQRLGPRVEDESPPAAPPPPEYQYVPEAASAAAAAAAARVHYEPPPQSSAGPGDLVKQWIEVDKRYTGRLIGRQGRTIEWLKTHSGAELHVDQEDDPHIFTATHADERAVNRAIQLAEELIAKFERYDARLAASQQDEDATAAEALNGNNNEG